MIVSPSTRYWLLRIGLVVFLLLVFHFLNVSQRSVR